MTTHNWVKLIEKNFVIPSDIDKAKIVNLFVHGIGSKYKVDLTKLEENQFNLYKAKNISTVVIISTSISN